MRKITSIFLVVLLACSTIFAQGAQEQEKEELPTVTWLLRQDRPANVDSVMEKVNEIVEKELGAKLDINFISWGDYGDKLNMKMAAGEDFDLAFVANWITPNYLTVANKGGLTPINKYMNDDVMPDIMKAIPDLVWKGVSIKGEMYGIPNLQVMYDQPGIYFVKDIVEKAGALDMIHDGMSEEEVSAVLAKIHAYDPSLIVIRDGLERCWEDGLNYINFGPKYFRYNVNTTNVELISETPPRQALYERARDWYEKGYIPTDASTTTMEQTWRANGKLAVRYNRNIPGIETSLSNNYPPFEYVCISTDPALMGTNGITSTLTGISATSKNPELAARVYNLIYKNADLYNLLVFGIEGQDYNLTANGRIDKINDTYKGTGWMMGNQFNALLTEKQQADIWEKTVKANSDAQADALLGFVMDNSEIDVELAAITAICDEYDTVLRYGLVPFDEIAAKKAEMMKKCKSAGLDKVVVEYEKQISSFLNK